MPRPPKSDAAAAKPKPAKRKRSKKPAQVLIHAIEEGAECISHKVDDLVEKLAPYPLQGG